MHGNFWADALWCSINVTPETILESWSAGWTCSKIMQDCSFLTTLSFGNCNYPSLVYIANSTDTHAHKKISNNHKHTYLYIYIHIYICIINSPKQGFWTWYFPQARTDFQPAFQELTAWLPKDVWTKGSNTNRRYSKSISAIRHMHMYCISCKCILIYSYHIFRLRHIFLMYFICRYTYFGYAYYY